MLLFLLNIDNPNFEGMVNQIYTPEVQLDKTNASDPKPFFDLHLSLSDGLCQQNILTSAMILILSLVNCPFLDGDVLMGLTFHNLLGLLECAVM